MSSESLCQVARSWVDVDSFHTCLFGVVYVTCGDFHDGSEKGTASVDQWHALFKTGRTSVDDEKHTGRPTSCTNPDNVARIQELNHQDRRLTIHDIAEEVVIGYGICQPVVTKELGMIGVAQYP
jgi:hypothetical protein